MNSSRLRTAQPLAPVSSAAAKEFLLQLANLRDDAKAAQRFMARFGKLFYPEVPWTKVREWAVRAEQDGYKQRPDDVLLREYWLQPLRDAVRATWVAAEPRIKDWSIFRILEKYFARGDRSLSVGPVMTEEEWSFSKLGPAGPCELILLHLKGDTRCCANPECITPYFFPARRSRKYCSDYCAQPAQREYKRRWWAKHGRQWREKRAKRRKKGKR